MPSIRALVHRLAALFVTSRSDRDLDEEIESHLQFHIDDNIRAGMAPAEARRHALMKFGAAESVKEAYRDRRGFPALERLARDIRFAVRTLRKAPGFTIVAVLTIAIGVGVNTGIFTVLNAAAFRPLNLPDADRLVTISQSFEGHFRRNVHGAPSLASYAEYRAYRDDSHVFSGVLAYAPDVEATLGGDRPQALVGTLTSCNYFEVLETHPALGRGFAASECSASGVSAVVVISDALWRNAFGANPAVIGRTVRINRTGFTIIGVAPPGFNGTEAIASDFYAPITMQPVLVRDRSFLDDDAMSWLELVGRLRPGVSTPAARAALSVIAARIDAQRKGRITHVSLTPTTLSSLPELHGLVLGIGAVILAAVTLVLLIACANLANLVLARATTRRREVALRLAIGASRSRIVQQFLIESLMLAAIGGAAGSLVSFWSSAGTVRYLLAHLPPGIPSFAFDVAPDLRVLAYALALTIATGLAFGIVPALRSSRTDLTAALRQDDDRSGPGRSGRLRATLVGVQAGVCVLLLVACGLMLRALVRSQTIDVGFRTDGIAVVSFDLVGAGYTPAQAQSFQRRLIDRLGATPGILRAVPAGTSPLSDQHSETEFSSPTGRRDLMLEFTDIGSGYFPLLDIPIVRGRDFTDRDWRSGPPMAIVSESAAARLWPGSDPLGASLTFEKTTATVLGIAGDTQVARLGHPEAPMIFVSGSPRDALRDQLLIKTTLVPSTAVHTIQATAAGLDPELVVNVGWLADNLDYWRAPARIVSELAGVLGAAALLLACTGVFGTVAYAVNRRMREIAIRIALGAAAGDVMRLVIRQTMGPVLIGLAIGLGCAAVLTGVLTSLLVGISPRDPVSFGAAALMVSIAALGAAYLPARRALRVEPTRALRQE